MSARATRRPAAARSTLLGWAGLLGLATLGCGAPAVGGAADDAAVADDTAADDTPAAPDAREPGPLEPYRGSLEQVFWYGSQPDSPPLEESGFGVDIRLRSGAGPAGPTVVLLTAGRLPGRYAEWFGGRLPGAAQVIAIADDTGQVYHARAEPAAATPLRPGSADQISGGAIEAVEVHFGADLRRLLELPPRAATYAVFVWLDELVSPIRRAVMPAGPGDGRAPRPAGELEVALLPAAVPTAVRPGTCSLRRERRPDRGPVVGELQGRATTSGSHLVLLALRWRTRSLDWWSHLVPADMTASDTLSFVACPDMAPVGEADVIRFLLVCGRDRSPILELRP